MKVISAFSGISYGNPGIRDWRRCVDNIERNTDHIATGTLNLKTIKFDISNNSSF